MATKKATTAVKKQYIGYYADEVDDVGPGFDSIEEAAEGYEDGEEIEMYEITCVGRFKVSTKPTLTPIK